MERAPAAPDAASSASSSSSSREDRASEAARLDVQSPEAVAVAVSEPPAHSADKVPLTEGAAPAAAAAPAEGEDGTEAEESAWADDQEELAHCSRSPWCHAFVYSVVTGVVTFFVLMFLHRF